MINCLPTLLRTGIVQPRDNTGTTGTAGGSGSQQSGSATSTSGGTSGKDSPKTGDDTAAGLWISFLALSGLGSVSLTILRRRRNR